MAAVCMRGPVHCHQVGHRCSTEGRCRDSGWQGRSGLDRSCRWPRGIHQGMQLCTLLECAFLHTCSRLLLQQSTLSTGAISAQHCNFGWLDLLSDVHVCTLGSGLHVLQCRHPVHLPAWLRACLPCLNSLLYAIAKAVHMCYAPHAVIEVEFVWTAVMTHVWHDSGMAG